MNTLVRTCLAAAALALAGCETMYPTVQFEQPTGADTPPPVVAAEAPSTGAIFQTSQYRPLFEDHRARQAGDTLQVRIVEKISATAKSTSSLDKTTDLSGGITALPGINAATALRRAAVSANSENSFAGKGSTQNSNDFQGTITVTVRGVLPNGHLLVAGEKQIGVNANVDVLRFSGQVDPRAIEPGNVVQSTRIANVRLEQRGRGAQADTNAVGWLSRVFFSVLWPL
ncbi:MULTISPECIES: flagellar basal body L-ring protein FlgH [Rubrivivax]|nr:MULTISPECIES: flagellar basal body L-ring protein FlgH [Rubrivivax]EGJ09576.1 flagellar basal-body L-ring protein [Rubrivivax benzoatilyticus JA2 = ATCC BAA-35]MCC9596227.1 flagellar basal body L-ring protein FlgH [Rubrivivax sp. JA1055]MCC9647432.1 flagellar basal body L-ring protein FlgH [Rubrivivax sp. JA1029]MCD0418477.1 flagellar basal body L-ring protein FlgH [Rubrivivax sp. JA1024]